MLKFCSNFDFQQIMPPFMKTVVFSLLNFSLRFMDAKIVLKNSENCWITDSLIWRWRLFIIVILSWNSIIYNGLINFGTWCYEYRPCSRSAQLFLNWVEPGGIVIHILSARVWTRVRSLLTSHYRPLVSNFKARTANCF